MKTKRLRLLIACLGCTIAVLAAVLGGVKKSRLEEDSRTARAELASRVAEMSRRDRLFDIASASRGAWEQSRIGLRVLYATTGQIYEPAVTSVENLIVDTLAWGSEAASGNPLSALESASIEAAARRIAVDEARRSELLKSPAERKPANETELAAAVSLVTSLRRQHIQGYWASRQRASEQQEQLRAKASDLEASVRSLEGWIVSLQIAGILLVLMRDFVPEAKSRAASPRPQAAGGRTDHDGGAGV